MKSGFKTLVEFSEEITRQRTMRKDYWASSSDLRMTDDEFFGVGGEAYRINDYAQKQIATKLKIPIKYYEKMKEVPNLRSINVNQWLYKDPSKVRFIRTLDGNMRAFLSDRFKPYDNYDLMEKAFLPAIQEYKSDLEVKTMNLSDTRMYLQIVFPSISAEIKKGDLVMAGIVMRNSEVGAGAVDIEEFLWRLSCLNGVIRQSLIRKYHSGRKITSGDTDSAHIYQRDTIEADIKAFSLRTRDIISHALKGAYFESSIEKMRNALDDKVEKIQNFTGGIEGKFGLTTDQSNAVLDNMISEENLNRYGLLNGLTALAHEIEDTDKQYEIEKMGSKVIELSKDEWKILAA